MNTTWVRYAIISVGFLLLSITGYSSYLANNDFEDYKASSSTWAALKNEDVRLNEHFLLIRTLMDNNYDALVQITKNIRSLQAQVQRQLQHDGHDLQAFDGEEIQLFALMQTKFETVERYKSDHAILQNSENYLPIVMDNLSHTASEHVNKILYDLVSKVYLYTIKPSVEQQQLIEVQLNQVLAEPMNEATAQSMQTLVLHMGMVMRKSSRLLALSRAILAIPTGKKIDEIKAYHEQFYDKEIVKSGTYKLLLAIFSGLLLFWISLAMKRQQAVAEALEDAISEVDYQKRAQDQHSIVGITDRSGKITYANKKFCDISLYTQHELIGQDHRILNSGLHSREFFKEMWKTIGSGDIWKGEICNKRKDGCLYWVDTTIVPFLGEDGKVERHIAIRTDITNRKKMELALIKSEENTRRVLETSLDPFAMVDENGKISHWNSKAEEVLGYVARDMIGVAGLDIVFMADEFEQVMQAALNPALNAHMVVQAKHRDGFTLPLQISMVSLSEDNSGSFSVFMHDISNQLENEKKLKLARDEAMESSRMKSMFLGTVSHEIRTPMNGIVGMSDLLLDTPLNSEQQHFVSTIISSSQALLTIINDILDFSKFESGQMQIEPIEFCLASLLEGAAELASHRSKNEQTAVYAFADDAIPPLLMGDAGRLRQVILNLTDNAIKFTEAGEVVLKAMVVASSQDSVDIAFSVRDTGIGIAEEAQGRLFQPFVQADGSTTRKYGGTGLGLAISKRIVNLMGGDIALNSELGKGTIFSFVLQFPIAEIDEALRWINDLPQAQLQSILHQSVLVVDDDEAAREIFAHYLSSWGLNFHICNHANQALAYLQGSPHVDAMIIDKAMPDIDGFALLHQIRQMEKYRDVPAILVTTIDPSKKRAIANQHGYQGVLSKPFGKSQLFDVLVACLHSTNNADQPLGQPASIQENTPLVQAVEPVKRGIRLLLVEDNAVNQQVACVHLHKLGYDVDIAANGQLALDAMAVKLYPVVLMDCQMPVMDGFEATRHIRVLEQANGRHTPIVAMTANAMKGDRERCIAAGMDDYVSKPISRRELSDVVKKWLDKVITSKVAQDPMPPLPAPGLLFDLDSTRALLGDDPIMIAEVMDIFIGSMRTIVEEQMQQAIKGEQWDKLSAYAHELRGASGNIGGTGIAVLCGEMEELCQQKDAAGIRQYIAQLQDAFMQVKQLRSSLGSTV